MPEPTPKSDELRQVLSDTFGFDAPDYIRISKCVPAPIGCEGDATQFRDAISEQEYRVTGLCQVCQDKIFAAISPDVPGFIPPWVIEQDRLRE